MKKLFAILLLILIPTLILSTTHTVNFDGTGDFIVIQQAIDSSVDGDTVLVYPGTYRENLNFNGRSIKLYSLEALTGEAHYISETILDGNHNGRVIEIRNQQVYNAEIRGFSITNASGEDRIVGGGISINADGNMKITNSKIYNNNVEVGGGVYIDGDVDIELAGLDIHDNCALKGGGILYRPSLQHHLVFSSTNRCSIYNNLSKGGMDIRFDCIPYGYDKITTIYLDKFTEAVPSRYYANYWSWYSSYNINTMQFDILRGHITPVNADLYVSMDGDDANSGLTPDDPKYSIVEACRLIEADSLNPKTVHIAAGNYSYQFLDRFYTPVIKSHCRIAGAGSDITYLGGYLENAQLIYSMFEYEDIEISGITFENPAGKGLAFQGYSGKNVKLEDVIIKNCRTEDYAGLYLMNCKNVELRKVKISDCIVTHNASGAFMLGIGKAIIDSCEFYNNHVTENHIEMHDNVLRVGADTCFVSNCIFKGNTSYCPGNTNVFNIVGENLAIFENNLVVNNISYYAQPIGHVRSAEGQLIVRNNTFANNYISCETNLSHFYLRGGDAHVYNNIFYNPYSRYESGEMILYMGYSYDSFHIYNNLIREGEESVNCVTEDFADQIVYEASNIDVIPEFVGGDSTLTEFYHLTETSPCVDAGVAAGSEFPLLDLAGNQRIYGSTIDMGCFEWQPVGIFDNPVYKDVKLTACNYPNPFNPSTTIEYSLPESGEVEVCIYNIKGQKVIELVKECQEPGTHTILWNGTDNNNSSVGSGVYFYKIKTEKSSLINKMIMLK